MTTNSFPEGGYTYAQAGVSIDAGNALVKAIGPLVKSTRRPGADGEIGGRCPDYRHHLQGCEARPQHFIAIIRHC